MGDESDALEDQISYTDEELSMQPKPKPNSKPKIDQIDETFVNHNQSWIYTIVGKITNVHGGSGANPKIRVVLTRNAYDPQSYANVDVFSQTELKWNCLISEVYTKDFKSFGVSYVETNPNINLFINDARTFFQKVFDIIK